MSFLHLATKAIAYSHTNSSAGVERISSSSTPEVSSSPEEEPSTLSTSSSSSASNLFNNQTTWQVFLGYIYFNFLLKAYNLLVSVE